VWSTLPSSIAISNGKYCSQIYENKYKVDTYMAEQGVPGPFLYTGNFFENSVLRGHVSVGDDGNLLFKQPVILEDTKCASFMVWLIVVAMLYVEKDFAQCVKVIFDKWDTHQDKLNHKYFYVANVRLSPCEFKNAIEKGIVLTNEINKQRQGANVRTRSCPRREYGTEMSCLRCIMTLECTAANRYQIQTYWSWE
jgi:hypothetical protein